MVQPNRRLLLLSGFAPARRETLLASTTPENTNRLDPRGLSRSPDNPGASPLPPADQNPRPGSRRQDNYRFPIENASHRATAIPKSGVWPHVRDIAARPRPPVLRFYCADLGRS